MSAVSRIVLRNPLSFHTFFLPALVKKCKLESRRTRLKTETATFRLPFLVLRCSGAPNSISLTNRNMMNGN
jgi:hypothetical protein